MSLTSVELNYLVWRYLQESGFELAAYAFERNSKCLDYAHPLNRAVDMLQPGCLPNLVQKGILYALLEESVVDKLKALTLVEAVLSDQKAQEEARVKLQQTEPKKILNGSAPAETEGSVDSNSASADGDEMDVEETQDISFSTSILSSPVRCLPSLVAAWHPSTAVIALGSNDLTAVIHALNSSGIAESVTLNHPPVLDGETSLPNPISMVSWDPQGTMVVTSGINGELRAWSPDGRLKNVANSMSDLDHTAGALNSLLWNHRGLLAFTIDVNNTFRLWDGTTLSFIQEVRDTEPGPADICGCWLGDKKFALSTGKNTIKIYSVGLSGNAEDMTVVCVGQLGGHSNPITNLCFSATSRLLASLSDTDYSIKVWNSQSSQDALELNIVAEKVPDLHYHTSPVIGLHWLNRPGDVQGIELLSISMDGAVNIWDAFTGDLLVSANVFQNPDNFAFETEQEPELLTKNSLIFATAISPNGKFLAIGDDSGNVSIWDVLVSRYVNTKDLLRCVAVFPTPDKEAGICELVWDHSGKYLTACYQGTESAILEWLQT